MNKATLFYLTALLASAPALASSIPALFPYAAQSHDRNGEVEMSWSTSINGTNGGMLDFRKKDDLKGQCDNITCTISGEYTNSYSLPKFNRSPFELPAFKKNNSSFEAKCSGSGTIKYDRDEYEKVEAQGSCRLYLSNSGDVLIKGDLSAQGSTIIYLDSGNYWLDSLKLSGSAKIFINGDGDVNFYVKDNVDVSISNQVGSPSQKVNIFHYDSDQVKLGDNATWYGDIKSYGDFELQGSGKFYGAVQAKSLELSGTARLYLDAGTYWYEEVDIQGSARVIPQGEELTTFYIEEDLELQGSTELGTSENPILAFVYGDGDDDGEAELEGSSKIYGYLYVEGELEMQGSTKIFGAVNVVDLEMEGSSSINYSAIPVSGAVHHYKLSFDIEANHLAAYACGDEACSEALLYSSPATLHIKDGLNNNSISNFNKFLKSDKDTNPNTKLDKNKCIQFVDKKADPSPEASPGLRCYLSDGTHLQNCKLCTEQDVQSSLAAYVYDEITLDEEVLGEAAPDFDFYIAELNGTGILKTDNKTLKEGSKVSFPLDLTYNKAEAISLTIRGDNGKKGKKKQGAEYQLDLVFVPKQLRWESANCGGKDGFVYNKENAASCSILGKAGEPVWLTLQAYGEGDKLIDDYSAQLKGIVIYELTAKLEKTREFEQGMFEFNQKSKHSFETASKIASVALIEATVPDSCASYAVNNDGSCMLETGGDTATVGRTVPDRLLVIAGSGKLENGIAYRGKEVTYHRDAQNEPLQSPYFSVMACAAGQKDDKCELPSYTGQFAAGLDLYGSLTDELLDNPLQWQREDEGTGEHIWKPEESFVFDKGDPAEEQSLHIQLAFIVAEHDEMSEITANAHFAGENDTLRYGFVTLMDSEIRVGESGSMLSKLHYYGENLNTLKEDGLTDYTLSFGTLDAKLKDGNSLPDLSLSLNDDKVDVAPYSSEQKDIEVTIEGLPEWLKPADRSKPGVLNHPSAMLDILSNPRLRGNDSTFNRREVIR